MKDFFDEHLSKLLGSAGFLGLVQFFGQLQDFMSDGKLDTHDFQQLLLSSSSAVQTTIIIAIMAYIRFIKKD